ncbi:YdiU family protein [Polyangium aurulentum]|nr:YdiU family protein [Polyangium aurulentum]
MGWRFDNTYRRLPAELRAPGAPAKVRAPRAVVVNHALAQELGLDAERLAAEAAETLGGNALPEGAEPIAQAYAGHQFGHFTMLGDGRALLLGEHVTPAGKRVDVALKGSGRTQFSRRGDGRAALGPMLREYIVSEAMNALGVPTTRSLAVVATGEPVMRESMLPGAVLTRIAASHLRVGTFEYAAARRDPVLLRALADYAIDRHDAALAGSDEKYVAWLRAVIARQASLVAKWLLCGFIHGVMNTDNMALSGETIDYGPCAFMDTYDPATVFSSIDQQGRYAFGNQPRIAQWNLIRFAEAILPLLHDEEPRAVALAESALNEFPAAFEQNWLAGLRRKLGLFNAEDGDGALAEAFLSAMKERGADYTNTWRSLATDTPAIDDQEWLAKWRARLSRQSEPLEAAQALMRANSPAVIPRNHRVEEALAAASQGDDLSVMERLLAALSRPYDDVPEHAPYREPPPSDVSCGYRTFCGT